MERLRYDEDKAFFLADDAATIARIVRTVPVTRLRATKFDQWTAVEIIGHVADAAEIFADRVQRCIDEDSPAVASYDQDAIAADRRNNERDLDAGHFAAYQADHSHGHTGALAKAFPPVA